MILAFADVATNDIFHGIKSKAARSIPVTLHAASRRKLDILNAAVLLSDLKAPPGNRLEKLKGSLQGFYSIRINNQYRIIFQWTPSGPDTVQILDYH